MSDYLKFSSNAAADTVTATRSVTGMTRFMPVSSLAGHPLEAAIEEDLIDLLRLSLEAEEHDLLQREHEELLAIKEKLEDDRTYLHEMIEDTCTSLDQSEEERETLATEVSANRKMLEAEKERIRLLQEQIAGNPKPGGGSRRHRPGQSQTFDGPEDSRNREADTRAKPDLGPRRD